MSPASAVTPSRDFREELALRGGANAARCYQCATCSSVCDLASDGLAFPRRQMLWAQWGLADRLVADPSVWLCHQCNDCTTRCPRDARPGDVMQSVRGLLIQEFGAPRFLARLVGRAELTWPLLLGLPILLWALLVQVATGFASREPLVYAEAVPHWLIYAVFIPASAFAALAALVGASRAWSAWGKAGTRQGSLLQGLAGVAPDILLHRRFSRCQTAKPRQLGHLLLFWGFAGALITTSLVVVALYGFQMEMPAPQTHFLKILGNASAVLLVVGALWLLANRLGSDRFGAMRAYDRFFLGLVLLLALSGVGSELGRYYFSPTLALGIYLVHLGTVLCLFVTFPYSKFAHALYRTLAMAHERLTQRRPT